MGPSLLDYARFHGIANSYLAIDPLGHATRLVGDTLPEAVLSKYNGRLSDARAAVEETLRQEKLHVPERAGRLLASVIREAQTERAMVDWDDVLPDFYRFGDMKLELPIFPMEDHSKSLHYTSHDIELQLSENPYKTADPTPDAAHPLSRLHANRIPLLEQIRKEKLVCSKGSISFMQNARDGGKTPIKELLGELDGLLGINCIDRTKRLPSNLVPLSPGHFPPSPTLVSDDHMLPIPVASELMDVDSNYTQLEPRISSREEITENTEEGPLKENMNTKGFLSEYPQPIPRKDFLSQPIDSIPSSRPQIPTKKKLIPQKRGADPFPLSEPSSGKPQPPVLRGKLGSLSAFMETRGKSIRRDLTAGSPYFASTKAPNTPRQENASNALDTCVAALQPQQKPNIPRMTPSVTLAHWQSTPRTPTQNQGLVLFLSTALLKTHLDRVQSIEQTERSPRLTYRDYTPSLPSKREPKYQQINLLPSPEEADIILSPNTGIILTTAQAAMQLYLPGHKPTSISISCPKSVSSPLRERIFRLSSRYEKLYVLLSHGAKQSRNPKPQAYTADKHLLSSMVSLTAFCASLSKNADITLLLIPSDSEKVAAWVLALAHKHACQLPPPRSYSQYINAFTPVNPRPQLDVLLEDTKESLWEVFLRHLGLNPFAAQVIMAVLQRDMQTGGSGSGNSISSLSQFVEMSSEERRKLFRRLLGENVLRRVDSLIEQDRHCDWALDFEGTVE